MEKKKILLSVSLQQIKIYCPNERKENKLVAQWNRVMTSATNKAFNRFFEAFSSHLDEHYSRPQGVEKEQIRNSPKRIRRLDSLARLIIKENTNNCAAVALINNKWYFTANDYPQIQDNLKKIFKALRKLEKNTNNEVVSTTKARNYLLSKYLTSVKDNPRTLQRLEKDVRKFLASLKKTTIFTSVEIKSLLGPECHYFFNTRNLHAEMRLISSLASLIQNSTISLGISKLCCKLCAAGVSSFQSTYHANIEIRGRHGNFYYAWTPSSKLLGHGFKSFVGKKAAAIYYRADRKTKKEIKSVLKNLHAHRDEIKDFFQSQRGGVNLNSASPASLSTEKSTSSENTSSEESLSETPGESSSDEE